MINFEVEAIQLLFKWKENFMILPSNIRQKIDEIIASNKQVNLKNV